MADEGIRLSQLVRDLTERDKGKPPPIVTAEDAAKIMAALHDEMDVATAARARMAAEQGLTIACKPGCNTCCENLIVVFEPELIAVAQWLEQPENDQARQTFLEAYPRWREQVGDRPARMAELEVEGRLDDFEELLGEVWKEHVLCAFNHDSRCIIYPVRPNVCRSCHALDTSELCTSDSQQPPSVISFPALDDFVKRTRPLLYAVHVAVRGTYGGPSALCEGVHRLLTRSRPRPASVRTRGSKIGRNAPCPCGSGKKYKRCCGA